MKKLLFGLALFPFSLIAMDPGSLVHQLTKASFGLSPEDTATVSNLLSNSISPNKTVYGLPTPLHIAAANGKHDIVALLLAYGADVNKQHMADGETPLHAAVLEINKIITKPEPTLQDTINFYTYLYIIRLLLNEGANPHIPNNAGMTAFSQNKSPFVTQVFKTHSRHPKPQTN